MDTKKYKLKELLKNVIDNRGKNPRYYNKNIHPVIDNVYIKNTLYPNLKDVARYIDGETYDNFLRGYVHKNMPIMTLVGSGIGNVTLCPNNECAIVQNTIGFETDDKLNEIYLYYYFLNHNNELLNFNRGSGQPSIKKTDILNMMVSIPNIDEQNKIVSILLKIDNKIYKNNQINSDLYNFSSNYYEEKIIKNKKLNWKEYKLSEISRTINGYSYKGNELKEKSNIGMATIKNFERNRTFKKDGFKAITPTKIKDEQYVDKFDILIACTDLTQNADIIGNAVMLLTKDTYKKIILSMDLVKVIPSTDIINKYILFAILNSNEFKNFALGYKNGTTVLHLNKKCLQDYTIKLPEQSTLNEIGKIFENCYKKISANIEQNRTLEQLRDTLLPKLMNGEIDLDNIDI